VGETFDTAERIAAYIGDQQLDGQFDFPLYYALRDAFIHDRMSLPDLMATVEASEEVYGDAQMASFLGNHDVDRWMTESIEGEQEVCVDGSHLQTALIWADESDAQAHFDRMALAWTWMFTQRFAPLIYYGDELGMPGYGDPDNRQPLWWYLEDPSNLTSVDEAAATLPGPPAGLVHQVASLARARGEHASFYRGDTINWWQDEAVYAYARSWDGDHMLALFNRQDVDVVLSNGLAFAGLPSDASYIDVLTSEVFLATGDQIDVPLSARQARVLVVR
jgi:glycosidase